MILINKQNGIETFQRTPCVCIIKHQDTQKKRYTRVPHLFVQQGISEPVIF